MPNVCILPRFDGADRGDGGIRRVVEAQRRWLPNFGWTVVDTLHDADLVATHAGVAADVPATTPLVNHTHGLYWMGYTWEKWALKMNKDVIKAMRRADVVTAPSEWVAQAIRRGSQLNPPVLYHGINIEEWPPASGHRATPYVLWNKTRIDPICDPRPVQELARWAPDVSFVTTLVWSMDEVPPNVQEVGVLPYESSKQLVQNAAVYLATTRETFGIGTLEAMACGIPVLGWDWGGQHEIVRHGVDGWLARQGDYEGLAEGLRWCLANQGDAGAAARERVLNQFTWEHAIARYAELYDDLVRPHEGPTVSVVIPAYNMERYLTDAVRSVLLAAADYAQGVEVIIVDDASTDGTGALAERLADEAVSSGSAVQIEVIHNTTNQYLAEALNIGIGAASGLYIVPLDADNMLGRGALVLLASSLDKDRDIDIAYGSMSVIEEGPQAREEWVSGWPSQFDFRRQLKHQNQIPSTSMYRKEAWERVGGYRRRCRTAEDADFWCRTTSFGANARKVTDAVVLRYRNRADSMSHVVEDWAWHDWYPWGKDTALTPWIAPVDEAESRFDPTIPPCEEPLVSVVIPVGPGHERLVLDALDSLNAQTFRFWEAIVVNDTGHDIPWLPSWARVVDSGASGAGAARNAGMAVARGRLFTFIDADDYFQPRALEAMVEAWTKSGGFIYTDWYKQETGEVYHAPAWDGCDSVLHKLPWPVTCLYPISAWHDSGGFDEALPAWEDWDFAIKVVRAGYCGTRVPVPLFHYRITSGKRREAGAADAGPLRERILDRYREYITGGKTMPCGCAGGGGVPNLPALDLSSFNTGQTILPPEVEGVTADQMVLIEFTDQVDAPLTFSGRVTGSRYRFGSDDDNRVRYVYRTDAEYLLTTGPFKVYNQVDVESKLMAAGPPR